MRLVPLAIGVSFVACHTVVGPTPGELGADHPLVDRIWDVRAQTYVEPSRVHEAAIAADFVLLGERHDHPLHHELQARVLAAVAHTRKPVLAWEMLDETQRAGLEAFVVSGDTDADAFGEAVAWDAGGWPEYDMYRPIAEAALSAGLTMIDANLGRKALMGMSREGMDRLGQAIDETAGVRLPAEHAAAMEQSIEASHCGYVKGEMVTLIATAQQVRDAHMAKRLVDGDSGDGVVFVAGGEHVRRDRAVPFYLATLAPDKSVVSIGWAEVSDEADKPTEYEEDHGWDFIWFTPRVDNTDPCEEYKEQLEKMRSKHKGHGEGHGKQPEAGHGDGHGDGQGED